ncbi:hypothetical protein PF005_g1212 [Phytophthora fragariae]|uniref:Secreted protein n=1 Tax=Phytophthora fragariae TaxID=53985 RepID=A0A6A3ZFW4_9STRA|nr:hypothetical protein PF003_g11086 [Phytophthora fragariae]KAE8941265.1 hypothetical protein PF009_g8939 [Phytophthora fragariae]KAE9021486.1 hypothetical protein PF011_g4919 [Phytophthora fragariae]KAE9120636.1 hypothetical protein PF010_g7419 [Phytophthora fragariae]KAE9138894.1 hypothetical protein PF007_g1232 [Phytophthora fragariae]
MLLLIPFVTVILLVTFSGRAKKNTHPSGFQQLHPQLVLLQHSLHLPVHVALLHVTLLLQHQPALRQQLHSSVVPAVHPQQHPSVVQSPHRQLHLKHLHEHLLVRHRFDES